MKRNSALSSIAYERMKSQFFLQEKMNEFQKRLDEARKQRMEERRKARILERKVKRRTEKEEKEKKEREEREKRGMKTINY